MSIEPTRRGLLLGLGATLVAAPAIVRVASIMPVRSLALDGEIVFTPCSGPGIIVYHTYREAQVIQYGDSFYIVLASSVARLS